MVCAEALPAWKQLAASRPQPNLNSCNVDITRRRRGAMHAPRVTPRVHQALRAFRFVHTCATQTAMAEVLPALMLCFHDAPRGKLQTQEGLHSQASICCRAHQGSSLRCGRGGC